MTGAFDPLPHSLTVPAPDDPRRCPNGPSDGFHEFNLHKSPKPRRIHCCYCKIDVWHLLHELSIYLDRQQSALAALEQAKTTLEETEQRRLRRASESVLQRARRIDRED